MSPTLGNADRVLLLTLLEFCNREKFENRGQLIAWPTQSLLARLLHRHRDSIQETVTKVVAAGAINRLRRGSRISGASKYEFAESWLASTEAALIEDGTLADWPDQRITTDHPRPDNGVKHHPLHGEIPGKNERLHGENPSHHTGKTPARGTGKSPSYLIDKTKRIESPLKKGTGVRPLSSLRSPKEKKKVKSGDTPPSSLGELLFEDLVQKVAWSSSLKSDEAFGLFVRIYPCNDQDLKKLKGAWVNAVVKGQENFDRVLTAALAWKLFAAKFEDEYVPPAGKWLRNAGWLNGWPYGADAYIDKIKDALHEPPDEAWEALFKIQETMESPFEVLWDLRRWRDASQDVAHNAFNAAMSRGITADKIIEAAKELPKGENMPLLGKWLAKLKLRDEATDADEDEFPEDAAARLHRYQRMLNKDKEEENEYAD